LDLARPRVRRRYLLLLLGALLVAGGVLGVRAVDRRARDRDQAAQSRRYLAAWHSLEGMGLPPGLRRLPSSSCAQHPLCAHSKLLPAQLGQLLRRLVAAAPGQRIKVLALGLLECAPACPISVSGRLFGQTVTAYAHPHLIIAERGRAPAGAVPDPTYQHALRRIPRRHVSKELLDLGTDIEIAPEKPAFWASL
jgi:hypothetical protein